MNLSEAYGQWLSAEAASEVTHGDLVEKFTAEVANAISEVAKSELLAIAIGSPSTYSDLGSNCASLDDVISCLEDVSRDGSRVLAKRYALEAKWEALEASWVAYCIDAFLDAGVQKTKLPGQEAIRAMLKARAIKASYDLGTLMGWAKGIEVRIEALRALGTMRQTLINKL